jgi:hypothetical protein
MQTEQTAERAKAEAGAVTETVKDEAQQVAHTAREEARSAFRQVKEDLHTRADEQAGRLSETLRTTSRQLRSMADGSSERQEGVTANLVREGASAADKLASRLEEGGVDAIMADARSWARRRPGAFVLGALAAGFVAGRVVRNFSNEDEQRSTSGNGAQPHGSPPPTYTGSSTTYTGSASAPGYGTTRSAERGPEVDR